MCSLHTWNKCSLTSYSSLTCKKQFRNDFPISPVQINNILSDELFLWHSKCAGLWLYQWKTDSLQSSFQQLKSKYTFFATATSIHCQTVPDISLLHNLKESVLGWICQLSCATQINSVSCLVNCLHDISSMQDTKCFCQASVYYDSLDNVCHILLCSPRRLIK